MNAKLIISNLETEERAVREPQFTYISVTFIITSNTHFQDCHTHFYGTFAFSDVFPTNLARRLISSALFTDHVLAAVGDDTKTLRLSHARMN